MKIQAQRTAKIHRQIISADRRVVKMLLSLPIHSDAFYSVLSTASVCALEEAFLRYPAGASRNRCEAIAERLDALYPLGVSPETRHA